MTDNEILYEFYEELETALKTSYPQVKLAGVQKGQYLLRSDNKTQLNAARNWILITFLPNKMAQSGYAVE